MIFPVSSPERHLKLGRPEIISLDDAEVGFVVELRHDGVEVHRDGLPPEALGAVEDLG